MIRNITSRHWFIAAIIISVLLLVIVPGLIPGNKKNNGDEITVSRESWFMTDPGTMSNSRYGYSALTESLEKKYRAKLHLFPSYPDRDLDSYNRKFFLIINSPERRWNEVESKELHAFLKRGGDILIVTPEQFHIYNVQAFIKELGIEHGIEDPGVTYDSWEQAAARAHATGEFYNLYYGSESSFPVPRSTYLKYSRNLDISFLKKSKDRFVPLLKTDNNRTVLGYLSRKEWNGGKIFWLTALLPGYNGSAADLVYTKNFWKSVQSASGDAGTKIKKGIKESGDRDDTEYEGIKSISVSENALSSGLQFVDSLCGYASLNNEAIVFFEYLADANGFSPLLAVFEAGAGWAIILIVVLILSGMMFFIRDRVPVDVYKEIRAAESIAGNRYSDIDPDITREGRVRFKAQFIAASRMLIKFRGVKNGKR